MKGGEGGNRERAADGRGPASDVLHFAVGVQPAKDLKKNEEVCFLCLDEALMMMMNHVYYDVYAHK